MVRDHPSGADLRLPAVAAAAWVGALAALTLPAPVWASTAVLALGGVVVLRRRGRPVRTVLTLLAAFSALAGGATVRSYRIAHDPVAELGHRGAAVHVVVSVTSDPRVESGRFGPYVTFRGRLRQVTASGAVLRVAAPVLVLAEPSWSEVRLGSVLAASGRLAAPQDADLSAVLRPRGPPVLVDRARPWWRAADRVRASLRDSVSGVPERYRALVPALVVGDDAGLAEELADDFATTGLTHLLAVSGTNLTLLLGFVLLLARWAGVHGRWRLLVAGLGVLGFVLLARPEPSVLRAAVMGAVGLVALGTGGAQRGARTLGAAVLVLLLVDPWLALRAGFALSVLATAGIVFVAPVWCDALTTWLPRWLAAAVAVPAAAQLACTPVVAALSGQVSLVAVLANLLAAPVVGPATVLGL
ncbi:MAG TPA: ComEC/Rec2 family competence protein, partial [Nocardioides sp.]|uniref:ComEC/Rec2 family competence protein n=1 Tax=Nocardioides sp. TaxID=35761 RepID=UPI002B5A77C1